MSDDRLKGRRVRLDHTADPYTTLTPGTLGTVSFVDSMGTVHVAWDNGSRLGMAEEAGDRFTLLPPEVQR
jgi:hypothetical protein